MIEYIQLRNFQSHKETELEFHPGVNVIVGESDHGKTAIMRAFYWAIFGKPAGDSMRRHGTKQDTEVTIETAEHQISRIRGNSTNQYLLTTYNFEDQDEQIFKGFGQTVPQPVMDALNINEINFMRQLDPPFLFSKTAGEVAQYLNRLINLDVIDTSLSNIKRMHSQSSQQAEGHAREIARLELALQKYHWTDDAEADVDKLERKEAKLEKHKWAYEDLDNLLAQTGGFEDAVKRFKHTKGLMHTVTSFEQRWFFLDKQKQAYNLTRNAILQVHQTKTALHSLPATKGAEKAISQIEKRIIKVDGLGSAAGATRAGLQMIDRAYENKRSAIADYKDSVVQLNKAMPEICPLCDQEIK